MLQFPFLEDMSLQVAKITVLTTGITILLPCTTSIFHFDW